MSGQKHKGWRTSTEERLCALESSSKSQRESPAAIDNQQEAGDQAQLKAQPQSVLRSLPRKTLKVFGVLFTLFATSLGIVTGYLALIPRVTIVETEPLSPIDPFSARFIFSNDGPLGINSVGVSCNIADMENASGVLIMDTQISAPASVFKPRMEVGERATLYCPVSHTLSSGTPVLHANIVFSVSFRPDFTWWHPVRLGRFVTIADNRGLLHWIPVPFATK